MGVVRVKPGVEFTCIAPGGFRLLTAIDRVARLCDFDLVITSACDGQHSGPADPHHRGEAYDVRSKGLSDPQQVLTQLQSMLEYDRFYCFIESPGEDNEHIHCQVRKGTVYP